MAQGDGVFTAGVFKSGGANYAGFINNIGLTAATTTDANDSIRITSADGSALSPENVGYLTLPSTTVGRLTTFRLIANVTIKLTGAHWGHGTTGDLTDNILDVVAINIAGTIGFGVSQYPGDARSFIDATFASTTATDINLPHEVLTTAAIGTDAYCIPVGWFKASFDDTGGASEDLWAVQTGIDDIGMGPSSGKYRPWSVVFTGFSANPTTTTQAWTMRGKTVHLIWKRDAAGTSNLTTFTMTAPIQALSITSNPASQAMDNSSAVAGASIVTAASSQVLTMHVLAGSTGWTNASSKFIEFSMFYEAR